MTIDLTGNIFLSVSQMQRQMAEAELARFFSGTIDTTEFGFTPGTYGPFTYQMKRRIPNYHEGTHKRLRGPQE